MDKKHSSLCIIVTGGAQGLGNILAKNFSQQGNIVYIIDINNPGSLENIHYVKGDISDAEQIKKIFSDIYRTHGRIDVLINNAAVKYFSFLKDMVLHDVAKVISVNLKAIYITTKEALPYMERNSFGRIINISSNASFKGYRRSSIYSATKAGVNLFTEAISQEVSDNITINVICPSNISTEETKRELVGTKYKGLINAEEVFKAAVRVINNSNINGAIIPVVSCRVFASNIYLEAKRFMHTMRYFLLK